MHAGFRRSNSTTRIGTFSDSISATPTIFQSLAKIPIENATSEAGRFDASIASRFRMSVPANASTNMGSKTEATEKMVRS
jgi:hypothetical protein